MLTLNSDFFSSVIFIFCFLACSMQLSSGLRSGSVDIFLCDPSAFSASIVGFDFFHCVNFHC
jgi:hypothetical protein